MEGDYILKKNIMKRRGRCFPIHYYPGEILTEGEAYRNRKLIYFWFLWNYAVITSSVAPCGAAVGLPIPSSVIERTQNYKCNSQFKKFLKIAPSYIKNFDQITLTNKQMKEFDILGQQVIQGSLSIDEAISQLRGGNGGIDLIVILLFVIFANWLEDAEAFQAKLPPHLDPMGWLQGSYNQPKPGPSSSFSKPGYAGTALQMDKPSTMPQSEYSSLTREQKRNLILTMVLSL